MIPSLSRCDIMDRDSGHWKRAGLTKMCRFDMVAARAGSVAVREQTRTLGVDDWRTQACQRHTLAPKYFRGGFRSGVKTMTSSPAARRPWIRHSNRFFMPLTWLNGLGSCAQVCRSADTKLTTS